MPRVSKTLKIVGTAPNSTLGVWANGTYYSVGTTPQRVPRADAFHLIETHYKAIVLAD